MRVVSLKSLCLIAGFVVPCLGTSSQAEAGVIPWLYNSIFGFGWGNNYGGGYGGGVPYSVGYGSMGYGYGGYGYSAPSYPSYSPAYGGYSSYGYSGAPSSCGCSSGISSAPVMSTPTPTFAVPTPANPDPKGGDAPPADGNYNLNYQPAVGYSDYYTGYGPAYVVDSGSCCVPCSGCANGDCATSIKSSKPAKDPTPAETPKKDPSADDFSPTRAGGGVGIGTGDDDANTNEALPIHENKPANKLGTPGGVGSGTLEPPVNNGGPPAGTNEQGGAIPSDRNIAVRYNPTLKRSPIAIPTSVARVVRVERSSRVLAGQTETRAQLAAKP